MKPTFFKCDICGNVMFKMSGKEVVPQCCGKPMTLLCAGTTDGNIEYHIPVIEQLRDGIVKVRVGRKPHPMVDEHYIEFLFLETERGGMIHYFKPDETPCAIFQTFDRPVAVYAYCNIHGLWKYTLSDTKCV